MSEIRTENIKRMAKINEGIAYIKEQCGDSEASVKMALGDTTKRKAVFNTINDIAKKI